MTYNPLVSVIITNYNYEKFLSEAIESVLSQTYKNYELIIVDDGSTDNSKTIIEKYYREYPDIIMPIYKENGGQASAFNEGYAIARGQIVAFLDSDDYWFPNKLEVIAKAHEKYKIVQHNLLKGEKSYRCISNRSNKHRLLKKYGYLGGFIPTSGLSFDYELLKKVFPIPKEPIKICAETFVLGNALYYENIYSISDCLGFYRVHKDNNWFSKEDPKKTFKIIEALNEKLISEGLAPIPNPKSQGDALLNSTEINPKLNYILYGAGDFGVRFFELISKQGGRVKYFSDSNLKKWGKTIQGVEIISPEQISKVRYEVDKILISSSFVDDVLDMLVEMGFQLGEDIIAPTIMVKDC